MSRTHLYKLLLCCLVLPGLLILACSFGSSTNNEAYKELKVLNGKYRSMKEYSMDISYLTYASHSSKKVEQASNAHYVKKGKKIFMKMEKVQTLQTEEYLVVVSDADKRIFVSRPTKDVVAESSLDMIEKALSKSSTLSMVQQDNHKLFNIDFKAGTSPYEKMKIYENNSTHCIDKIEMLLAEPMKLRPQDPKCKEEKPRMEVLFSSMQLKSDANDAQLNESSYFHKKDKGYEPAPAYKNYKLINNYY
ncbi:MAG: hypothetical protein K0S33_3753 [Bacteroidetes bacterium]|jgi:hypothetical protein|nr:hypothetical protein [Bacteroidota bacterium]